MYPLLLLPGLMNDARVWHPVLEQFQQERACAVFPTHQKEGVEAIAAAAIQIMPDSPFCVAGFSLGGYVALEVFRQAPERIRGLALLSTGARSDTESGKVARLRMIDLAQSTADTFAAAAQSFLPRILHPNHLSDPALVSVLTEMARSVGREGFIRQQLTALHRPDSLDTLEQVHVPTLVLCGSEDQISPMALSREMAQTLKNAELAIMPKCGHMVTLEEPSGTIAAMKRWLQRLI